MNSEEIELVECPISQLTEGKNWHFFGYYDRPSFDSSGNRVLVHQVAPMSRFPEPGDTALVGFMEPVPGSEFHPVGETRAWNWQQGASLQWVSGERICYNTRRPGGFGTILVHPGTGDHQTFERPAFAIGKDGLRCLSLNAERLMFVHPTICYASERPMPGPEKGAPDDDGLYEMSLESDDHRLILSLSEAAELQIVSSMQNAYHWFSHPAYSPSGDRLFVLHRWSTDPKDQTTWRHRILTVDPNSNHMRVLECTDPFALVSEQPRASVSSVLSLEEKETPMVSHPVWRDNETILAWSCHQGQQSFFLYHVNTGIVEPFGEDVLTENGHVTFSPDGRFLLLDTYPDEESNCQTLMVYDTLADSLFEVGRFLSPKLPKECRCDLHPRWRTSGQHIIFDSMHLGERQVFSVDVSGITRN